MSCACQCAFRVTDRQGTLQLRRYKKRAACRSLHNVSFRLSTSAAVMQHVLVMFFKDCGVEDLSQDMVGLLLLLLPHMLFHRKRRGGLIAKGKSGKRFEAFFQAAESMHEESEIATRRWRRVRQTVRSWSIHNSHARPLW